jgi:hypothetical protein
VYGFAAAQTAEDETWIDHAGRHATLREEHRRGVLEGVPRSG